jgi:peptidoglycan/xylan/chitin deacetylase (PgdA/CDA1 family)
MRPFARARAWLGRPALVLMYHRIATLRTDPWQLAVTPEHFAEHLDVVRRRGQPQTVRELTRRLAAGRGLRRGIVMTFDDGYADNVHHALPLLERHDVPGTMFVVAGCVGRRDGFWWDQLERLILAPRALPPVLRLEVGGAWREYRPDVAASRQDFFLTLYWLLRPLHDPERRRLLAELTTWVGEPVPADPAAAPLAVDDLQALARTSLVEIGAHTVTHPQLSALDVAEQRAEIGRSRSMLREATGADVVSFAYPYGGRSDYTAETVRLVGDAGFAGACATISGPVTRSTGRWEIPRFQVTDCDGDGLARRLSAWMTGAA